MASYSRKPSTLPSGIRLLKRIPSSQWRECDKPLQHYFCSHLRETRGDVPRSKPSENTRSLLDLQRFKISTFQQPFTFRHDQGAKNESEPNPAEDSLGSAKARLVVPRHHFLRFKKRFPSPPHHCRHFQSDRDVRSVTHVFTALVPPGPFPSPWSPRTHVQVLSEATLW